MRHEEDETNIDPGSLLSVEGESMEHEQAVQAHATEKYLLGELLPEERDAFEEHLFDCRDCADDLRAAAAFVEHSKVALSAPDATPVRAAAPAPAKPGWLSWLRPAIAAPVFAALLAVIAYQSLVPGPASQAGRETPMILSSASLIAANSRGGNTPTVNVSKGNPFLAFLDVPSDPRFVSYTAELYDPAGAKEWTLPINGAAVRDTLSIQMPAVHGGAGTYVLAVYGLGANGERSEAGRYSFEVHEQ